jgi:hypothetical protein
MVIYITNTPFLVTSPSFSLYNNKTKPDSALRGAIAALCISTAYVPFLIHVKLRVSKQQKTHIVLSKCFKRCLCVQPTVLCNVSFTGFPTNAMYDVCIRIIL